MQSSDENCMQFVTAVRSLLAKCDYAEAILYEILRDKFVVGAVSDKIRERLMLENDTLTIEQALVIAGNVEKASKESKQVQGGQSDDASISSAQTSRGRDRPKTDRTCFSCGNHGHFSSDQNCPARGRKYTGRGKEGHFIACFSKNKGKGKRSASRGKLDDGSSKSVEFIELQVEAVSSKRLGESKYVQWTNRPISLLLDTGARVGIIRCENVVKLQLTVQPATDMHIKVYGGSPIATLCAVETSVSCGDHIVDNFMFVVVDKGSNVMGIDLFEKMHFSVSIPTELLNSHVINMNNAE